MKEKMQKLRQVAARWAALSVRAKAVSVTVLVLAVALVCTLGVLAVRRTTDRPADADVQSEVTQTQPTDATEGEEPTEPTAPSEGQAATQPKTEAATPADKPGQSDPQPSDGKNDAPGSEETLEDAPVVTPSPDTPAVSDPAAPTDPAPTAPPVTDPKPVQENRSTAPNVTFCAPVATGIYIVGGNCPRDTEYIQVSGANTQVAQIVPTAGRDKYYFFGQVQISAATTLDIQGKQPGLALSAAVSRAVTYPSMKNLMTSDEYMPVFGKQSRIHFYSAILSYTLSDAVPSNIRARAKENISRNVAAVKAANPDAELIYLVIPSSAAVYPETLPDGYNAAAGNTVFDTFSQIATGCGATVIYPLDDFVAHKNDGEGYKIYQNTDSHWSTYGAYFGVAALMNHVAQRYPTARPRSLDTMGFYTAELCGGDALFSFGDNGGFENISATGATGRTPVTGIMELTTLYRKKMPTSTLSTIYHRDSATYIGQGNSGQATFVHPAGANLPTALVLRDSFGCTAYDMINDRFSTVWWQDSHRYPFPARAVEENKPDYVIYLVSERNLIKVMLENSDAGITSLAK